jgi:Ca2+-binding RTX toxin-like protein
MEDNIQCDTNETIKTITTQTITQTTILETTQQTTQKTTVGAAPNNDAANIEYPPFLYVLSDNVGYVGSYYSISDIEEITSAYHLVTFMIQCFKTSKTEDLLTVWVVLYKDIDAVAYVSNNRMDAVKVHSVLMQMGIAYMDCIDYWKQPVGLAKSAKDRLDAIHSIKDKKLLDDSYNIFIQKLNLSNENLPNGPIEQLINETQKISIIDAIIPSIVSPFENDTAAAEDAAAITAEEAVITSEEDAIIAKKAAITSEEDIEQLEKELYQRIKDKKVRDAEGVTFCENCKVLSNEFYSVVAAHNAAASNTNSTGAAADSNTNSTGAAADSNNDGAAADSNTNSTGAAADSNTNSTGAAADSNTNSTGAAADSNTNSTGAAADSNTNSTGAAAAFEKTLMSFIANHCYLCFHNIRNFYRQNAQKKIKDEINYPIDSPFISTSKNNIAPKVNDKLSEAMNSLNDLMKAVPSPEELQNLSADEILKKYGSDMIPETKESE